MILFCVTLRIDQLSLESYTFVPFISLNIKSFGTKISLRDIRLLSLIINVVTVAAIAKHTVENVRSTCSVLRSCTDYFFVKTLSAHSYLAGHLQITLCIL